MPNMKEEMERLRGNWAINKNAVVLLSGGVDSTVMLSQLIKQEYTPFCVAFDYGQRHRIELDAARKIADQKKAPLRVIKIDPIITDATGLSPSMPFANPDSVNRTVEKIRATGSHAEVPGRNTLFLSHALAEAHRTPSTNIFIGANAADHRGFPDCRREDFDAFESMAQIAMGFKIRIHTPFIHLQKSEVIAVGLQNGTDFSNTWSCYNPTKLNWPCRICDACVVRDDGFAAHDLKDPAIPT